jgi:hypothetical protein
MCIEKSLSFIKCRVREDTQDRRHLDKRRAEKSQSERFLSVKLDDLFDLVPASANSL